MTSNYKNKLIGRMQKSLGFVDLYFDESDYPNHPVSYKGFLCGDKRTFLSCPFLLPEAKIVRIRFLDTADEYVPVTTFHETSTGVTTFIISTVPGLEPLFSGDTLLLKQGINLFVPNYTSCEPIHSFISGKLMLPKIDWSTDDPYYINHDISAVHVGCPLIDNKGSVMGIINRASELTEDDFLEIKFLLRLKKLSPKAFKDKIFSSLITRYKSKMANACPVTDIPF